MMLRLPALWNNRLCRAPELQKWFEMQCLLRSQALNPINPKPLLFLYEVGSDADIGPGPWRGPLELLL